MQTQEIWFPEVGIEWPAHGAIVDAQDGSPVQVIAYAGYAHLPVEPPPAVPPTPPARPATPPRPASSGAPRPQAREDLPEPEPPPVAVAAPESPVAAAGGPVTPQTHPHLHTILDLGQAVPPLMHAAKALGFVVSYSLHGEPPDAVITL